MMNDGRNARWRRTAVGFERRGAVVFAPREWFVPYARWRCDWAAVNELGILVCGKRGGDTAAEALRRAKCAASWARRSRR